MGFQLEDGTGKGYLASVSSDNKLRVAAVISSQEHYENHNQGRGFSAIFESTPVSGGCFIYIKNTDTVYDLSIEGFWLKMEADDYIDINFNDIGTPTNTNSVTPRNLNTGSGNVAIGSFYSGNNIGGLSSGNRIYRLYHANTKESIYRNFNMDIILAQNGILTMNMGAVGGTPISCMLIFNYHGVHN